MIDEKKLIERIEKQIELNTKYYINNNSDEYSRILDKKIALLKWMINLVKSQPKVNKWIPVEEAMPPEHDSIFANFKNTYLWGNFMFEKISDDVNVTIEFDKGKRRTSTMHTTDGEWIGDHFTNFKVIAWMPLPKEYEKEVKNNDC